MGNNNRIVSWIVVFAGLVFSTATLAQNKVVVIPMAGDDSKPLANVISVATANGDFTSPIAALNSITDASDGNRYLVVIAPGVYDLGTSQLVMKDYVEITGSGEHATVIKSQVGNASATSTASAVIAATNVDNAGLRDLTVENSGVQGALVATGIALVGSDLTLDNITVSLTNNSGSQQGIIASASRWELFNSKVRILDQSAGFVYGVRNDDGRLTMIGSNIELDNLTVGGGIGLVNGTDSDSEVNIADSEIKVTRTSGGSQTSGIENYGLVKLSNADIEVSSSTGTEGLLNTGNGSLSITRGSIIIADQVISDDGATSSGVFMSSVLIGTFDGEVQCAASFTSTEAIELLNQDCSLPL